MLTTYEPLQCVHVPCDDDVLFSAITLSMLLPVLTDTDAFEDAFERLFGDTKMRGKRAQLRRELNQLTPNTIPASLPNLIKDYLRPKLAGYYLEHELATPTHDVDFERHAISAMLEISIEYHKDTDSPASTQPLSAYPEPGQSIHLLMANDYLQPLINTETLPSALRTQLFPVQNTPLLTPRSPGKCLSFEGMLQRGFTNTSTKLTALANKRPYVSGILSEKMLLKPAAYPRDLATLHELPLRTGDLKKEIHAIKSNLKYVNLKEEAEPIQFQESWENAEIFGAAFGALGGLTSATLITLFTEFELSLIFGTLAFPEGIPLALTIALVGTGIGVAGGPYAAEFGQALVFANQHLEAGNYEEALVVLNEQFEKTDFVKWTRSWFLTHEHYAVAHFFRAVCYEKAGKLGDAYTEYELAQREAFSAGRSLTVFLSKLHKLSLLKRMQENELPPGVVRETKLDSTLRELTREYEIGFSDLYCKLHDNIFNLATRCLGNRQLSETDVLLANQFLLFDGAFMIKHFANGRGEFLALFSTFFQGALLAYFSHDRPEYLNDEVRDKLLLTLPEEAPKDEIVLVLASQKIEQALDLLGEFKKKYGYYNPLDKNIQAGISSMETFIVDFHAHCVDKGPFFKERYEVVTKKLGISAERVASILENVRFSMKLLKALEDDFGLRYVSLDAWLDDILDLKTRVSDKTGDTMLHWLARLPSTTPELIIRIKEAAEQLKESYYVRNNNHESPLLTLETADPHQLKPIISPGVMIKIGDELDQVDAFLESIKRDPINNKHFLLLEGPPGTGKSHTVLQYLRAQRHVLHEWNSGAAGDKWVGGLKTRIRTFFETAKSAAIRNLDTWHVLFMDEIDAVCPQSDGAVANGQFNRQEVVTEIQKQHDTLRGCANVVLVGATNYPEVIADAMLSRAHRVVFSLPNVLGREKLLQYFFREKRIAHENIIRMAHLTTGWSARSLLSLATSIESHEVNDENLKSAFIKSSTLFESDFKKAFPHARITLPTFNQTQGNDPLSSLSVLAEETREQFMRLASSLQNPSYYNESRLHTLLFGPPGGGKTTAVRTFASSCNVTFVLIEAGVSLKEMHGVFERAKSFNQAIIFIDEIDRIAFDASPFREFLQEQMDGFLKNNVVIIGATNYPKRIADPLMSRFVLKTYVPPFSSEQRGKLFESMLRQELANNPGFQLDEAFHAELESSCLTLGGASGRLSVREITNRVMIFFGDLRVKHATEPHRPMPVTLSQLLNRIDPTSLGQSRGTLFSTRPQGNGSAAESSVMQDACNFLNQGL